MCGNSGLFHGQLLSPYIGHARNNAGTVRNIAAGQAAADPALQAEQTAAQDVALRRRRARTSSLLAGGSRAVGATASSALGAGGAAAAPAGRGVISRVASGVAGGGYGG